MFKKIIGCFVVLLMLIAGNNVFAEQIQEKLSLEYARFNVALEHTYTGEEITPAVDVSYCGTTLNKNIDYTLLYENNINAGIGKIIITGIGKYYGEKTISFCIKPSDIAGATINGVTSQVFSENTVYYTQDISVTKGRTLIENVDYIVSYQNNTDLGTAYIIVDGIGNYRGRQVKEFNIIVATNTTSVRVDYDNRNVVNTATLGDKVAFYMPGVYATEGIVASLKVKSPSGTTEYSSGLSSAPYDSGYDSLGYFSPSTTGTYTITYVIRGYSLVVSGGKYIAMANSYGGTQYTQTLKVSAPSAVSVPTGSVNSITINPVVSTWYDQICLSADVQVSGQNTNSLITWKSSNEDVAVVNAVGTVTFLKPGTTMITATTYGGLSNSCEISISPLNIASIIKDVCLIVDKRGYDISLIGDYGKLINPEDCTVQIEDKGEYVDLIVKGCGMYTGEYRCSVVLPKVSDIIQRNDDVIVTVAPNIYKGSANIFVATYLKSGKMDDACVLDVSDISLGCSEIIPLKITDDVTYKIILWENETLTPIKKDIEVFSSETEQEKVERLTNETLGAIKSYVLANYYYSSSSTYKAKFYADNYVGEIWYFKASNEYTLTMSNSESKYSFILNMEIEDSRISPSFTFYAYNSSVQYYGVVSVDSANYKDGDSLNNVSWNFSDSIPGAEDEKQIMQSVSKYHARLIKMLEIFLNSSGKTIRNIGYASYYK